MPNSRGSVSFSHICTQSEHPFITTAREVIDAADTSSFDPDQRAIWREQKAIYSAFLAGDRARIDRRIHPDATIWDAVTERIARGLAELDAIRATRPTGEAKQVTTRLEVDEPIIDVSGDLAVARHVLRVEREDADGSARELMRVSQGWRRIDGEWNIIHSHEDLFSIEPLG
ncbi:YybH family protein [Microbacterium rhizomatis]|uniref:YybH family protein n=1 Tax=Microbacterium rhizomatis TaxID=1631477 RepID=UPI00147853CA|nr:nuclear transport factor 2 family protein [Microbacterium rhizomatis]